MATAKGSVLPEPHTERHRGDGATGLFTQSFRETMARVKGSPEPQTEGHSTETYWHPKDAAERDLALKRLLSCDYDGFMSSFSLSYDPTIGHLLCMPREQVQGRLHNMVSGISLAYGLILSGVAGSALSPLTVQDFPESSVERNLANFYNLAAAVQCTICVVGSLCTTFVLGFVSCQPDTTILRCAANFGFLARFYGLIGWSLWLLLVQCGVILYLRSDPVWAFVTIGLMVFMLLGIMHLWAHGVKRAMPELALHMYPTFLIFLFVSPFIIRWFLTKKEDKEHAEHAVNVMLQEAENNFGKPVVNRVRQQLGSGQADDRAGIISASRDDEGRDKTSLSDISATKGLELKALITRALPDASADRCKNLVMGMLIEELTLPILVAMASRPLGLHMVDGALREKNMRMQLLTGERMAIVEAIANIAAKTGTKAGVDVREVWPSSHVSGHSFGCGNDADERRIQELEQGNELLERGLIHGGTLRKHLSSSSVSAVASAVADNVISYWDRIEKAKDSFERGLITQEEYVDLKQTWLKKLKET